MFHWHLAASGVFLSERLHPYRGRTLSHMVDDFADPDFPGASDAAKAAGLPYLRGGTVEMGGSQGVIDEASLYAFLLTVVQPDRPFGAVVQAADAVEHPARSSARDADGRRGPPLRDRTPSTSTPR